MKNVLLSLTTLLLLSLLIIVGCKKKESASNSNTGSAPSAPTNVSSNVSGSNIIITWNSVSEANSYSIVKSSSPNGNYYVLGSSTNTYYYDNHPLTDNYYKIKAINNNGDSPYSSYTHCHYSSGGGNSAPTTPTELYAVVVDSGIKVSWNSVSNATAYKVKWSKDGSNYNYTFDETSNTYLYDNYPEATNYYKVMAKNSYGESDYSSAVYCQYPSGGGGGGGGSSPSSPTNVNSYVNGSGVQITWNSVSSASYYKIYRSSSSYGTYASLSTSYSTSYYDNSPLTENYYKVTAVNDYGESEKSSYTYCYYSGGGGGGTTAPSAPTGVSATNYGTTMVPNICISWNDVSNTDTYKVYRSSSANGSYSQIGSETSSTYLYDSNPMNGNNYYKVKAFNSAGSSPFSDYAVFNYNAGAVSPCPPTVSASGSTSYITVSWTVSTSSGCGAPTRYEVYKRNPYTSSYDYCTETTSKSYRDNNVHPGINRYAIKAINDYGNAVGYGTSSSITLPKPSSFNAQKSGSDVYFTWSKVSMASGYQIFSSSSASGTYYIFDQVDDPNATSHYSYYPASTGTKVYFKMRAYWQAGGTYEYSDFTPYKMVTF